MTYLEQLESALPDQRDKFRRMRNGHVFAFFVIDILAFGTMLAWLIGQPQQPLWKTLIVSVCGYVMVGWNLWWAAFYDAVMHHTEETIGQLRSVTRRGNEQGTEAG